MPCPMGFGGGDDSTSEEEGEVEEIEAVDCAAEDTTNNANKKKAKKSKKDDRFDKEKDPVSWFYQNQIKSEEEFKKRKAGLREEAKKRLDKIMDKKGMSMEWPDDSDIEGMSIHSSEISDLNSDVDSLGSLISCAESWIGSVKYHAKAESTLLWVSKVSLVVSAACVWLAYQAGSITSEVGGVAVDTWWPAFTMVTVITTSGFVCLAMLAANKRSKRMLLVSQSGLLVMYSVTVVLTCLTTLRPTAVDPKLREVACGKLNKTDAGSELCKVLPSVERELASALIRLICCDAVNVLMCLTLLVTGVWYMFELAYIEKKALKHKRRHKRRKHSIPWDKIKIIGPVLGCGANSARPTNGAKCPVSSWGAAAGKKTN